MGRRHRSDASRKRREPGDDAASGAGSIADVDRQIAAISRGDYVGAIAQAHHDVELEVFAPREFNWRSYARGRVAIRAALKHNRKTVETHRRHVGDTVSQVDAVVLFGREQGCVRQTGEPYDVDFVHRLTFRDGRLASIRIIAARSSRALRVLPRGAAESRKTA